MRASSGAHEAFANRLYELIVGARRSASSFPQAIQPARKRSNTSDLPEKAFVPSCQRLAWMWQLFPIQEWSGFAINVIACPCWAAISLAPFLKTTWLSAVATASE